jgi:hypothetical protein
MQREAVVSQHTLHCPSSHNSSSECAAYVVNMQPPATCDAIALHFPVVSSGAKSQDDAQSALQQLIQSRFGGGSWQSGHMGRAAKLGGNVSASEQLYILCRVTLPQLP